MKIKTKLAISFCIIIFVPVVLTSIVLVGFNNIQLKAINKTYGMEDAGMLALTDTVQFLNKVTGRTYDELEKTSLIEPSKLLDSDYLTKINKKLEKKYSYLIVKSEGELIFNGGIDNDDILRKLPRISNKHSSSDVSSYMDSDDKVLIKQLNFRDSDGDEASLYIVTSTACVIPEVRTVLIEGAFALVFILLTTAAMLIVWIYRSIITPIERLRIAAENIKDGNLDFELETSPSDGEIGELCTAFEQMRARLKKNAEEKVTNESENRVLISNIAHDLKTPITAVKGYAEGIIDGVANTPEKVDKYVRTIYNKANDMDKLINELTLYSKIDTNRIPYTFNKIHVKDYFEDCIDDLSVELESSGVSLTYFDYLEEDAIVIADAEQLKRVINNIISNSLKYMNKPKGVINIRLRDVGDFIQIEIEDNGKGIAQKDLANIFDRFYRTDASRNSSKGGSGIGLSIVKKIMEDHGGQVWATSKEGTGTTMYLALRKYQEVPVHE